MNRNISAGLLTLLTDDRPQVSSESRIPGGTESELEASLILSISNLLNTRWRMCQRDYEHIRTSEGTLMNYGLPDFVAVEYDFIRKQELFFNLVKHAVEQYEPRLRDVSVIRDETDTESSRRSLAFLLKARLAISPYRSFTFNSRWEPTVGRFRITQTS